MAQNEITLTFRIRKPWWTHLAFSVAKLWVRCGLPFNLDRFSRWLAGHFKISAE